MAGIMVIRVRTVMNSNQVKGEIHHGSCRAAGESVMSCHKILHELFEDLRGQWCVSLHSWAFSIPSLRRGEVPRLQTRKILIRPFLPTAKSDSGDSRSDTGHFGRGG